METYLFKFSACLAIFWLVYFLFLERQTMHRFKRFYLLGAVIAALIIPALTITHYIEPIVTNFEISPVFIPIESSLDVAPVQAPFWDLETVFWIIYGFGVLLFSLRFIVNLIKMYQRISQNETITKRSFIYVLLEECRIPHSFFKYLFFDKSKYESHSIPDEVKLHEETHAKQFHSLDIIVIELLQIVFWFHPLIYILKHHIKLNHEFLADQAVLEQGADTKTYQNLLLQFSSNTQDYQLSSAINYSSIKKRFTVMKTQTSKTRIWVSSLLLLPIVAILFYSFAEKEYVEKESIAGISEQNEENFESNLFLVTVEKKENLVELRCKSGCQWSHLILEPSSEPYIINDYGFSEGNTIETDKFTFSIMPSENGVNLNGLKGTAWTDLSFSLSKNIEQAINKFGMTKIYPEDLKDIYNGKHLEIKAINNQLMIDGKLSSIDNYANELNKITQEWSEADFKSTIPELEIMNCSQEFLDQLDAEFRKSNYFQISIQGSKSIMNQYSYQKFEHILDQEPPIMWILINRRNQLLVDDELGTLEIIDRKLKKLAKEGKAGQLVSIKYDKETSKEMISKVEELVKVNKFKVASFNISPIISVLINSKDQLLIDDEPSTLKSFENKLKKLTEQGESGRQVIIKHDKETSKDIISKVEELVRANKFKIATFDISEIPPPPPPPPIKGGKINDSQIENYNNWVKNLKDPNSNYQMVKKEDYEYFMSIYNLMTDEQKKKTVGLPPPPPPPAPKTEIKKSDPIEINGATYYFTQENGKTLYYDQNGKVVDINKIPPPPPIPQNTSPEEIAAIQKAQDASEVKTELSGYTIINGEKLYYVSKNGKTTFFNYDNKEIKMDNLPPPPPVPESTLDFVIRMAKANAKFFNEGESISSDKAIDLIKKNPQLNVQGQKTETKQPLVYITKKPIYLGKEDKN